VICRSPAGVTETIRHAQTVWAEAYTEAQDDDEWGDGPLGTAANLAEKGASAVGGAIGWVWGEAKGRTVKRLARAAVGKNPISFVVPCHRVLGKGGSLCGYHWGLTRKRAILGWEAGVAGEG